MPKYQDKPRRANYSCEQKAAYAAGVAYRAADMNKRVVCKNEECTESFKAGYKAGKDKKFPARKYKK